MAENNDQQVSELKREMASLKSDMSEITETLKQLSSDKVDQGRKRVEGAAAQSREQVRRSWDTLESEIEQRPLTSMAAALGVGFLLGKVLDR